MNLYRNVLHYISNVRKTPRPEPRSGHPTSFATYTGYLGPDVAAAYWAVMACIKQIAPPISALDWYEYQSDMKSARHNGTALLNSPLSYLLNLRPNGEMTAKTFRESMMLSALLHKGAYAEIERNNRGDPIALWPLAPWTVTPEREIGGKLVYKVQVPNMKEPEKEYEVVLQEQDIFKITGLSWDGINAIPTYQLASLNIALGLAADQFAMAYFKNGVIPNGIIKNPGYLDKEVVDHLLEEFYNRYQGVAKSGQPLYLDNGLDYQPLTPKFVDAEFNQSRVETALQVCGFFGVPSYKIGLETAPGYGATATQARDFEKTTLLPWVVALEQEAQVKLLSRYRTDRYTKFSFESLMRGNITERYEAYAKGIQFGFLTPNRVAEMEGMPAYPDGDMRLNLTNMTTAEGIQASIDRIKAEIGKLQAETEKLLEEEDSMEVEEEEDTSSETEDTPSDDVEEPQETTNSTVNLNVQLGGFTVRVENTQPDIQVHMPQLQLPDINVTSESPAVNVEVNSLPTHDIHIMQDQYVSTPSVQITVDPPQLEPPNVTVNVDQPLVVVEPNITVPTIPPAEVYIVQPNTEIEGLSNDQL